jgi:uncharacterized Zn finger protein
MSRKRNYPLRNPLAVYGGIRSQCPGSNGYVRVWWGRRWIDMMEQFQLGARLGRGRNYAEAGQVSAMTVVPGMVRAVVQGARKEPYESFISFKSLAPASVKKVVEQMRKNPVIIARLLVGDLPLEIETLLQKFGCQLFPVKEHDLVSRCSCPDWANPCKHLAAVYYLLGEEISKNPLLLLELRGITRTDIFTAETVQPARKAVAEKCRKKHPDISSYYGDIEALREIRDLGVEEQLETKAPLLHRLGAIPFWRGQGRFIDTLENLYDRAAVRGWKVWLDEPLDVRREDEKIVIKGANLNLRHKKMTIDATLLKM